MKALAFIILFCALIGSLHAQNTDELQRALTLICDHPEKLGSAEYAEAAQRFSANYPLERLEKLAIPERALDWLPEFGPCGGPGSPLLVVFLASVARDSDSKQKSEVIHQAWLVVLKYYGYFRMTAPEEFPEISALEVMKRKEKEGTLLRAAASLFEEKSQPSQPARGS